MLLLGKYITKIEYLDIVSDVRQLELVRDFFMTIKIEEEVLGRDYYYDFSR